jgi:hypothetical protein
VRLGPEELFACDAAPRTGGDEPVPCALAVGRLFSGRLHDPRLTLACGFGREHPLAFAWITVRRSTRWLAVRAADGDELFRTAGELPVRVAVRDGVSTREARVRIAVRELGADGRVISTETRTIVVAG